MLIVLDTVANSQNGIKTTQTTAVAHPEAHVEQAVAARDVSEENDRFRTSFLYFSTSCHISYTDTSDEVKSTKAQQKTRAYGCSEPPGGTPVR